MSGLRRNRVLVERALADPPGEAEGRKRAAPPRAGAGGAGRPARSVTVNLAESPLGWLRTRGHVSARQYEAGERLRCEWERSRLGPSVTMKWNAPPIDRNARGAPRPLDPTLAQVAARQGFDAAVAAVGPGLSEILWRIVCAGEGMREAERALGWPARGGKLVLGLALDRLADFYRMP